MKCFKPLFCATIIRVCIKYLFIVTCGILDVNLGSDFVFCAYIMCRPFGGRFTVRKVVGSRFIIISGNLTYQTVQDFLSEFYHPNHNQGSSP
jgi:hypothetical protein